MLLKNRNISSKIKRSKVTDYAALNILLTVPRMWIIHVISGVCLLCFRVRLFIVVFWSPAGKGLTSWLSFVMSYCEFVTFPLVSWVRCGT